MNFMPFLTEAFQACKVVVQHAHAIVDCDLDPPD